MIRFLFCFSILLPVTPTNSKNRTPLTSGMTIPDFLKSYRCCFSYLINCDACSDSHTIIAGDNDKLIPSKYAKRLYATARELKEIWIIPGANHGGNVVAAGVAYEKKVGGFFDKYLKRAVADEIMFIKITKVFLMTVSTC
jgi:hypothetical protein